MRQSDERAHRGQRLPANDSGGVYLVERRMRRDCAFRDLVVRALEDGPPLRCSTSRRHERCDVGDIGANECPR